MKLQGVLCIGRLESPAIPSNMITTAAVHMSQRDLHKGGVA